MRECETRRSGRRLCMPRRRRRRPVWQDFAASHVPASRGLRQVLHLQEWCSTAEGPMRARHRVQRGDLQVHRTRIRAGMVSVFFFPFFSLAEFFIIYRA